MIQRRFLSFFFVLLFAFAQQQALVHPYVHLANAQESTSQETSTSDKHGQTHSETCDKCIAFAGVASALSSHALTIAVLPTTFEHTVEPDQPLFSALYFPYHSRAPPALA